METKTEARCKKCWWIHEADSVAKTSFRGVGLCPIHAAAPDLLATLQECITEDGATAWKSAESAGRRLEYISNIARAAIAKAEGKI